MSLQAKDLIIQTRNKVRLLGPLSLCLEPGGRVGLTGESGSGKSLLGQVLMGRPPKGVEVVAKTLSCFGQPWGQKPTSMWRRLAWVPQEPAQALHPFLKVEDHLVLLPKACLGESATRAMERLLPMLERLRLPTERGFLGKYPHQMSGGQRQRLVLALSLSCEPEFLILDEPTTGLDSTTRREVLELIDESHRARGLGYLWISHDMDLLASVSDRLMVLYGGAMLEAGPSARLLHQPRSPYVARLLSAARGEPCDDPGFLPLPALRPAGCPFQPRCPVRQSACGNWGAWRGAPEDGFRCEKPLGEHVFQV